MMFTALVYSCHVSLIFFLLGLHGSLSEVYIISPAENTTNCADQQCMALSQFAVLLSNNSIESNSTIELVFLSGNHKLSVSIMVHNLNGNFQMRANSSAVVVCEGLSIINFIDITGSVQITDMEFIGCGDYEIINVEQFMLSNSKFESYVIKNTPTALHFVSSNAQIINCTFSSYRVGTYRDSVRTLEVVNSSPDFSHTFPTYNATVGGAIVATHSNVSISHSNFSNNSAQAGGAIFAEMNSSINIMDSSFINNVFSGDNSFGGALFIEESTFNIDGDSLFYNNQAFAGGAIGLFESIGTIFGTFISNYAAGGGVVYSYNSTTTINGRHFSNNSVPIVGGVVYSFSSTIIMDGEFDQNSALRGAVLYAEESVVHFQGRSNLKIIDSSAGEYATLYLAESTIFFVGNVTISNNKGTLVIFNSNVTFAANISFFNGTQVNLGNVEEGGALTAFQSNIFFNGVCKFYYNFAENGAALHITESLIYINGIVIIENNTACSNGGGMFLYQSEMNCQQKGTLMISNNKANRKGGGIYAVSSTIKIISQSHRTEGAYIEILKNRAESGGGLFLEANARIYVLKRDTYQDVNVTVNFISNAATFGGAVYVDDSTNSGTCIGDSTSECFFQVLALHQFPVRSTTRSISLSQNYAYAGSALFGGLLDRCRVSPFAEIHHVMDLNYHNGIEYIRGVSTISGLSSISSHPVRLCSCINEVPQCNYTQLHSIKVKKGEMFSISLIAVDQIGQGVNATIQSSLTFTESGLDEGQLTQRIINKCTTLYFSVSSPHAFETLSLYASDGPCRDAELSTIRFKIEFLQCTCPLGFQVSNLNTTNCMCECHERINDVTCDTSTESLTKLPSSNIWFSYINTTELNGYLVYLNCPYDYCRSGNISINLNVPNGADVQCAFQRSNVLCGSCLQNFSLSLGSSRCLSCPDYWPALLVSITVAGILAGFGLVTIILVLNMTVSVGTLNGLIFYANIVSTYKNILLPFQMEQNVVTILMSWLNLDFGIDSCYFQGMDAFSKAWLQLAFPIYILFLVVMIIALSSCSTKFAGLIGKRNPVATLATLILLSYTKFLTFVLTTLTFGTLEYPDGSHILVWLPDATVKFLNEKHIVLFITAIILLLTGLIYTALLFFWQWLLLPKWWILKFVKDQRLYGFVECYNAPHTPKHRYWTGLLLLMRVILVLLAQTNTSNDPHYALSNIVLIMGILLFLKGVIGIRVYKAWPLDVLEMLFHFNILCFATFTFAIDHPAISYTSVSITLILLVLVILYHLYTYTSICSRLRKSTIGARLNIVCKTVASEQDPKPKDDIYGSHELLDIMDASKVEPTCTTVELSTSNSGECTSNIYIQGTVVTDI